MATAWVQGAFNFADAAAQATLAVAFGGSVTSGNAIGVFIKYGTATSVFNNITDNQGNTYTAVDSIAGGLAGANTVKSFYAKNVTGGSVTVTLNFTGSTGVFPRIMVHEISGVDTTSSVLNAHEINNQSPVVANATDALTSDNGGGTATTVNGCLILGFVQAQSDGSTNGLAGTSFTDRTDALTPPNNFDCGNSESRVQSTAGSVHATFTPSAAPVGGEYFTTAMMAFAPPGAGGTTQFHGFVSS